jgi:aspartate/methionine/tyrosine aminotransferase
MFVWANTPDHYADGYALSDDVLEKAHVFITPGGIFGSSGVPYVRVSLCSTEEVFTEALNRIKSVF